VASELVGSALAGLLSRTIFHPIDTLKSKLQSKNPQYTTIHSTVKSTFRNQGLYGFYRGLGAVLVGGIPGVSLYLTTYEVSCP
jgi:solute carrier family 25 phosphate transporter 23/24/25/41